MSEWICVLLVCCYLFIYLIGMHFIPWCVGTWHHSTMCGYLTAQHDVWVPDTTAWCILRLWMEERPLMWRVAAKMLNKQSRTADKGCSSSIGLGKVLTTPHHKNWPCYKTDTVSSGLNWSFGATSRMEEGHKMWYVECKGACIGQVQLTAAARELARGKLDLVGVQEVRWEKGGMVWAGSCILFMEKATKIINWEWNFLFTSEYYQKLRK